MKLFGEEVKNDNIEIVVIPRKSKNYVFQFGPCLGWEEKFDQLCPPILPPKKRLPGNKVIINTEDPSYKKAILDRSVKVFAFQFLLSINFTEGLVWDTVKLDDSETWTNYTTELSASGFTQSEVNLLIEAYMRANSLDEAKLNRAREDFLSGQLMESLEKDHHYQDTEQQITQSGEPVSDLGSNPQE